MKVRLHNIATIVLLSSFLLVASVFIYQPSVYAADDYGTVIVATPQEGGLGQKLQVQVRDLTKLVKYADCTDGHQPCTKKEIILYLDDMPMTGLMPVPYPSGFPSGTVTGTLSFHLQRNAEAKDAWNKIIGSPKWQAQATKVSVGTEDGLVLPTQVREFNFVAMPHVWVLFWLLLVLVILSMFGWLTHNTNLLRNSGPEPDGSDRKPYSLARLQMAWWFFLVLAAYLFIGIVTGDFAASITNTVLVLIGISAVTAISGAVIDKSKENSPTHQAKIARAKTFVEANLKKVSSELAKAHTENDTASLAKLEAKQAILQEQDKKLKNISQGWYLDILSDTDGISFHRFQIAAWTLVLGIIFVVTVYQTLAMPDFDQSLLTLLGISAGTYIGFKIPEPIIPTGVLEPKEGTS